MLEKDTPPGLREAAQIALRIAESWIHDQLDGTRGFAEAMAELEPVRAAIANTEPQPADTEEPLRAALAAISAAEKTLDRMQLSVQWGSTAWHMCETVDDRLHDAAAHIESAIERLDDCDGPQSDVAAAAGCLTQTAIEC